MVSLDLSWSEHVNMTVNKANKLLGLVHRTVGSLNPDHAFSTLYKSVVYPVLEHGAPAWIPYLIEDVLALERVQQRASLDLLSGKNVMRWNYYEDRSIYNPVYSR